jgi:hypothetical protein
MAATFTSNNPTDPDKDMNGLLGKLQDASNKLNSGKFSGAIKKLTDYQNKVRSAGQTGKLDPEHAFGPDLTPDGVDGLDGGAQEAIDCVNGLGD